MDDELRQALENWLLWVEIAYDELQGPIIPPGRAYVAAMRLHQIFTETRRVLNK